MARTATQRRLFLLGGLAGVAAGWQLVPMAIDWLSDDFEFTPLQDPVGFRSLARGDISRTLDVFIGLDDRPQRDLTAVTKRAREDLNAALFPSRTSDQRVQVAYFSDFYCPYCRVLSGHIMEIAADTDIDVSWHETPIFGPVSELAARGAISAGRQGAYEIYHRRLIQTPVQVTIPFLQILAEDLSLDVDQFTLDLGATETQQDLDRAAALASIFRFIGTPAMVVGRTVVQGKISETNLRQLIAREAADGHLG